MAYYIEYIFLENVIVNYIIIYELTIFVKCKVNKISFIIGILLLSCYSTAIYFYKEEGIINSFIKILVV
ncbi:MAG: sigma-E processing peptidase SpoIIGA, partial [Bacilli bacterium]|nr:sigma-E processing peptidase SpoIIGA [Bacilli bacterium]